MHNYKNLKIWHEAMDLVTEVYSLTKKFPEQERYGLTSQLQRAAVSIPSNIAEGTSRVSQKEFKHFLSISLGSSYEVGTQIELAKRFSIIDQQKAEEILTELDQVEKMIIGFMKSLHI